MLSHNSIEERIENNDIKITYYFIPRDDKISYYPQGLRITLSKPEEPQLAFFKTRLFSDRLGVTLGPIIKSHNPPLFSGRPAFRGKRGYTDIRDTGGILFLAPGETISVATNERIALGASTAALILPRITLGDAGLLLNVAYIDPFWDGTLQLVLTNSTPHPQSLSLLEPIAQCFFFDVSKKASNIFQDAFPAKSHHYGQNWSKILDEQAEPFPLRKHSFPQPTGIGNIIHIFRDLWSRYNSYVKIGSSLLLVTAGVSAWTDFSKQLRDLPEIKEKLSQVSPYFEKRSDFNLPALKSSIDSINARLPISGIETINLPSGISSGTTIVSINSRASASSVIFLSAEDGVTLTQISSKLVSATGEHARYNIELRTPPAPARRTFRIKWVFIP